MSIILVTTPIRSTFSKNKNLIIGEWCRYEIKENENYKIELSKYHWDDTKKMKKGFDFNYPR